MDRVWMLWSQVGGWFLVSPPELPPGALRDFEPDARPTTVDMASPMMAKHDLKNRRRNSIDHVWTSRRQDGALPTWKDSVLGASYMAMQILGVTLLLSILPVAYLAFVNGYLINPQKVSGATVYYGTIICITIEAASANLWHWTLWRLVFGPTKVMRRLFWVDFIEALLVLVPYRIATQVIFGPGDEPAWSPQLGTLNFVILIFYNTTVLTSEMSRHLGLNGRPIIIQKIMRRGSILMHQGTQLMQRSYRRSHSQPARGHSSSVGMERHEDPAPSTQVVAVKSASNLFAKPGKVAPLPAQPALPVPGTSSTSIHSPTPDLPSRHLAGVIHRAAAGTLTNVPEVRQAGAAAPAVFCQVDSLSPADSTYEISARRPSGVVTPVTALTASERATPLEEANEHESSSSGSQRNILPPSQTSITAGIPSPAFSPAIAEYAGIGELALHGDESPRVDLDPEVTERGGADVYNIGRDIFGEADSPMKQPRRAIHSLELAPALQGTQRIVRNALLRVTRSMGSMLGMLGHDTAQTSRYAPSVVLPSQAEGEEEEEEDVEVVSAENVLSSGAGVRPEVVAVTAAGAELPPQPRLVAEPGFPVVTVNTSEHKPRRRSAIADASPSQSQAGQNLRTYSGYALSPKMSKAAGDLAKTPNRRVNDSDGMSPGGSSALTSSSNTTTSPNRINAATPKVQNSLRKRGLHTDKVKPPPSGWSAQKGAALAVRNSDHEQVTMDSLLPGAVSTPADSSLHSDRPPVHPLRDTDSDTPDVRRNINFSEILTGISATETVHGGKRGRPATASSSRVQPASEDPVIHVRDHTDVGAAGQQQASQHMHEQHQHSPRESMASMMTSTLHSDTPMLTAGDDVHPSSRQRPAWWRRVVHLVENKKAKDKITLWLILCMPILFAVFTAVLYIVWILPYYLDNNTDPNQQFVLTGIVTPFWFWVATGLCRAACTRLVGNHPGTSWAGLFLIYMAAAVITRLLSVGMHTFNEQVRVSIWLGAVEFATRSTVKFKDMLTYVLVHGMRPPSPYYFSPRQLRLWADVTILSQLLEHVVIIIANSGYAAVEILSFGRDPGATILQSFILALVQTIIQLTVNIAAIACEQRMGVPAVQAWQSRWSYQVKVVAANGLIASLYLRDYIMYIVATAISTNGSR